MFIDWWYHWRKMCIYLTPSFKRWLSKFHTNLSSSFVLIAVASRQDRVKTVDFTRRICSKESENGSIGQKGYGHRFSGFVRHHLHWLFGEGNDNHGAVLCWVGPIRGWSDEKGPIRRRKMTTDQLTHPQLPQQNWSNYATNCCLIYPIFQISPMRFLFVLKNEKWVGRKRFTSKEEVIAATEGYFVEFDKPYFLGGLKKGEYRWAKCIELKGDYIEK